MACVCVCRLHSEKNKLQKQAKGRKKKHTEERKKKINQWFFGMGFNKTTFMIYFFRCVVPFVFIRLFYFLPLLLYLLRKMPKGWLILGRFWVLCHSRRTYRAAVTCASIAHFAYTHSLSNLACFSFDRLLNRKHWLMMFAVKDRLDFFSSLLALFVQMTVAVDMDEDVAMWWTGAGKKRRNNQRCVVRHL